MTTEQDEIARLRAEVARLTGEWGRLNSLASTGTAENFLQCDDETKKHVFADWIGESARRKQAEREVECRDALIDDHLRKIMHLENRIEEEVARAQSAEAERGQLREAIAPFADFANFLASDEIEGTSPTDELSITFEESGIVLQRFTIAQFDALRALIEKENGDGV